MLAIRRGAPDDFELFERVDTADEGIAAAISSSWTPAQWSVHRDFLRSFFTDPDKVLFVAVEEATARRLGLIAAIFHHRVEDEFGVGWLKVMPDIFPRDGRWAEVFQLWVDPSFRRRGLATALKRRLEEEAMVRGVSMLYTHTESANQHVVDLNLKLGYRAVWRGLLEGIDRISLVKYLPGAPRSLGNTRP